jgi:hypothetical protein
LTPDQGASFLKVMDWAVEKLWAAPAEKSE